MPVYCTLYVHSRLIPNQDSLVVQREIEGVLTTLKPRDPDLFALEMDSHIF